MEVGNRVEILEEEFKLIKGELKQTLTSVRDYLMESGLPDSEYSTILAAMMAGGPQQVTMKGDLSMAKPEALPKPPPEQPAEEMVREEEPADQLVEEEEPSDELVREEEPADELVEEDEPSDELVREEEPSDELVREDEPSDEMVREGEPSGEMVREGEPSDEMVREGEPSDEMVEEEEPVDRLSSEEAVEEEDMDELPQEEEVAGELLGEEETVDELPQEEEVAGELLGEEETVDELPEEEETLTEGEPDMAETGLIDQPVAQGRHVGNASQSTPRVDLLANMIRWVANAKAEIGKEQLLTFLEVYGISGHLTPEFKEVIMHLAETAEQQPAAETSADIWSRLMLELHGILTGGDAPLHPVKPFWNYSDEAQLGEAEPELEVEEEKRKEQPTKLKLVVTTGDGSDKEFCLDLNPSDGGES